MFYRCDIERRDQRHSERSASGPSDFSDKNATSPSQFESKCDRNHQKCFISPFDTLLQLKRTDNTQRAHYDMLRTSGTLRSTLADITTASQVRSDSALLVTVFFILVALSSFLLLALAPLSPYPFHFCFLSFFTFGRSFRRGAAPCAIAIFGLRSHLAFLTI